MAGKVCLIQRGNITFAQKVQNCVDSGGVGAVIYNNVDGDLFATLGDTVTTIPSVGATLADGNTMLGQLGQSATVGIVPDPADRATIEEEHALELRTRDRERKLLKKISQSLARIDAGDYGFCDETGEPIGLGRLIARPTATLSLEAQQRRELKQKMFGD